MRYEQIEFIFISCFLGTVEAVQVAALPTSRSCTPEGWEWVGLRSSPFSSPLGCLDARRL